MSELERWFDAYTTTLFILQVSECGNEKESKTHMIGGSTYSLVFFFIFKKKQQNLPDFKSMLSLSLTSLKYRRKERKERKKILAYI